MELVCLDLEGVLVPEIWIAVARETGLSGLNLTTRDISDYDDLMHHRLKILDAEGILFADIQRVICSLEPLDDALDFTTHLRAKCQMVILSDTFEQFAIPLMQKLEWPTLFCNTLEIDPKGRITGYRLRQKDGKQRAVKAFKDMGLRVFAAGDSYNDLTMLGAADSAMLFRAPDAIQDENPQIPAVESYADLHQGILDFIAARPAAHKKIT